MKAGTRFSAQAFLDSPGPAKTISEYRRGETVFTQGDACQHVFYIRMGGVRLSALSRTGHEVVVAMLGPGDFFGEGCLAGQPARVGTATAMTPSVILLVARAKMVRLLRQEIAMADRFIAQMLSRTIRTEEDLLDQLFSSIEKRHGQADKRRAGGSRT